MAAKKEGIMNILWDKKLKMNNYSRIEKNTIQSSSLLGKSEQNQGTQREINLLSTRLNKLFPTGKK